MKKKMHKDGKTVLCLSRDVEGMKTQDLLFQQHLDGDP